MRKKKNKRVACSVQRIVGRTNLSAKRCSLYAKEGFTLIEFMVAASIMGLIGLSILTTFGSGFSVYERVQAYGGVQIDALLALEEVERDVRNIFPLSTIPIEGEANRFSFPAVIEKVEEVEGEEVPRASIGKIAYFLDSSGLETKVLTKSKKDYSEAVSENASDGEGVEALVSVSDLAFRYYSFNVEEEAYHWDDSWSNEDGSGLKGVEITLTYPDVNRDVQLVRTVLIPAAGNVNAEEGGDEGEQSE